MASTQSGCAGVARRERGGQAGRSSEKQANDNTRGLLLLSATARVAEQTRPKSMHACTEIATQGPGARVAGARSSFLRGRVCSCINGGTRWDTAERGQTGPNQQAAFTERRRGKQESLNRRDTADTWNRPTGRGWGGGRRRPRCCCSQYSRQEFLQSSIGFRRRRAAPAQGRGGQRCVRGPRAACAPGAGAGRLRAALTGRCRGPAGLQAGLQPGGVGGLGR